MILNLFCALESPGGVTKTQLIGIRVSHSVSQVGPENLYF